MATTTIKQQQEKTTGISVMRNVMAFPQIKRIYRNLMSRVHLTLEQQFLDLPFTVIINALPRDHDPGTMRKVPRFENVQLKYIGIDTQKELLQKTMEEFAHETFEGDAEKLEREINRLNELKEALVSNWGFLDEANQFEEFVITKKLYDAFALGDFKLEDIEYGRIQDYFKLDDNLQNPKFANESQANEYEILKAYGLIKNYYFLSVPLIQFGEFDGVVHIIMHQDDLEDLLIERNGKSSLSPKRIRRLIQVISRVYEGLILAADTQNAYLYRDTVVRSVIEDAKDPNLFKRLGDNPILREVKSREYYKKYADYLLSRVETSTDIPLMVLDSYRRIAILSILVDSYAHNISAHSLTALEWAFKLRGAILKKLLDPKVSKEEIVAQLEELQILRNLDYLDNEMYPFLRFMLDKGAFWSGLTRESNFGGKVSNILSVLWYNFAANPLYLGTIAYSEGIKTIKIRISILQSGKPEAHVFHKKRVKFDGELAIIDLSRKFSEDDKNDDSTNSRYITKGADFDTLKKELQNFRAFFPGGVVGEHAFFTILENEIRNVKHFDRAALNDMRKNGLTLNLSFEEDTYEEDFQETKYYKIGVWIKQKMPITEKLLRIRLEKLWNDIITKESYPYPPKLGGIFQDKVCASMLFNNAFSAVQDTTTARSKRFYPYVKVGCGFDEDLITDKTVEEYEISARRFYTENEEEQASKEEAVSFFQAHFKPQMGYYKKYFHLWKGEELYNAVDIDAIDNDWENLARFSFVYLPKNSPISHFQKLRETGIVRIIEHPAKNTTEAYRSWLNTWLKKDTPQEILFSVKGNLGSALVYENDTVNYYPRKKLPARKETVHEINLVHGSQEQEARPGEVRIRQHGVFRQYFCEGLNPELAQMTEAKAIELFEILNTHVCIFDNRIATRIATSATDVYKKKLNCFIHKEERELWEEEKKAGFDRFHFLVIHLSFIEAFTSPDGNRYNEDNIEEFITEEVIKGWAVQKNFILVITTGRGRTQWWENLNPISNKHLAYLSANGNGTPSKPLPYSSFVTFRPVESLLSAVENSLGIKDDLDLKHRLVKVLFGS